MEAAALWIAIVSALGTVAATVIAWTARADQLRSDERARVSADDAKNSAADALAAQRVAAHALAEMNTFIISEPQRARRRDACFQLLDAFFNIVSLPGQERDMWHSEEHWALIDAEKRALFDLGSRSPDAQAFSLTRDAFNRLTDFQRRDEWDESRCKAVKGVVGGTLEELAKAPQSDAWWAERRKELAAAF